MASLCGKNIRCGDCDEFTWSPGVCEPLQKILQPEGLIQALNVLDAQYAIDRQHLIDTWSTIVQDGGV